MVEDRVPLSNIYFRDDLYNFEESLVLDEDKRATANKEHEVVDQGPEVAVDELSPVMLKMGISDAGKPFVTILSKAIEALSCRVLGIYSGQDPSICEAIKSHVSSSRSR